MRSSASRIEYKSLHLGLLCQTLLVISSKMIHQKMIIALLVATCLLAPSLSVPLDEKPAPVPQVQAEVAKEAVPENPEPEVQAVPVVNERVAYEEAVAPESENVAAAEEKSDLQTANTFWGGYGGWGGYRRPYYGWGGYGGGYGGGWRRGWGGYGYGRGLGWGGYGSGWRYWG